MGELNGQHAHLDVATDIEFLLHAFFVLLMMSNAMH